MHARIRDVLLGSWGRLVATRPWTTLAICIAVAAVSVVLTARRLEFRSDRSDLVDPKLSWNRLYAKYKERFDRWDDLIVCIEGEAGDERVDALARRIAEHLAASDRVVAADAGFDVSEVGPRLYCTISGEHFDEVLGQIADARRVARAPNANAALATMLEETGARQDDAGRLDELDRSLEPYVATLEGGAPDFTFMRPTAPRWLPLVSGFGSGRIRFIQVQLADLAGTVDQVSGSLAWLRTQIAHEVDEGGLEGIDWGITGIPAIEADETAQSIRDSTVASIVALALITLLMRLVFRGMVVPLLAAGSLLIGMCWSFGWLVISVGHLQLLSVVFSVVLLGLGIDFALHIVARLELVQDEHETLPDAIARVFRGVGPGMVTGAVTTAAAFGATALTEFKGMAEMGVIAGGGIILCLIAVLSSFPAGLAATRRWKKIIRHRPGGEQARFAHGYLDWVDFHPAGTLVAALAVVLGGGLFALRVGYDPNVLNLHPPGIESVEWERRIVADDSMSVWAALIETTAAEAPGLVARLRALPEVGEVGAMGLLIPPDLAAREEQIDAVRQAPAAPRAAPAGLPALRAIIATVVTNLEQRAGEAPDEVAGRLRALASRLRDALAASAALDEAEQTRRFAALEAAFLPARDELRRWVDEALAPRPPGPQDLPKVLREQWLRDGVWLLHVSPRPDPQGRSVLHPDRLGPFIHALRTVDPQVLGPPVQIYESSELIKREYIKAAAYAVAAILLLLLLDFRSLADALSAMLPVFIGFLGAFAMMGIFSIPLNFANIIVMPLIFGIGVDAGVHTVHRWLAEPYGRPAGLSGGTGRGITLTMVTTMIGFGCMLIARHRGIRSLGFVMVAGLGVCLLACYVVLPAVLRLRTQHWGTEKRE